MMYKELGKEILSAVLDVGLIAANAYFAAKPLQDVLSNYKRENAISLLSEYIVKYKNYINISTSITELHATYVPYGYYQDKSDDFIKNQIQVLINIIRTTEVVEEGGKTVAQKAYDAYSENKISRVWYLVSSNTTGNVSSNHRLAM